MMLTLRYQAKNEGEKILCEHLVNYISPKSICAFC